MWIIFIIFMLILSLYLTIKLKGKNYKLNIKELIKNDKSALFLTLGTKIGVGSIIGTLSSILIGGFSSIIWIILFSFLSTSLIYYESYLGRKYKEKFNGNFIGGPYFILKNGLNSKYLKYIAITILIILYCFLFQMVQVNTLSNSLINTLNINKSCVFLSVFTILFVTVSLSQKDTKHILNKVVPFKCFFFIFVCMLGIIFHINDLISSLNLLFKDIFNIKSLLYGLVIGVKRSIFMNEILIGTTSISSATDKNNIDLSIKYQLFSVYIISLIITLLVTCLLLIYLNNHPINNDYNLLLSNIFYYTNGYFGNYFLIIILILFASTSLLGGYYILKSNIDYLFNNKTISKIFKFLFIFILSFSININIDYIWKYTDILIFIMIIINSYCIIKLRRKC